MTETWTRQWTEKGMDEEMVRKATRREIKKWRAENLDARGWATRREVDKIMQARRDEVEAQRAARKEAWEKELAEGKTDRAREVLADLARSAEQAAAEQAAAEWAAGPRKNMKRLAAACRRAGAEVRSSKFDGRISSYYVTPELPESELWKVPWKRNYRTTRISDHDIPWSAARQEKEDAGYSPGYQRDIRIRQARPMPARAIKRLAAHIIGA